MLKIISTLFGGSKSEKDVKKIQHLVGVINGHFEGYRALDNDQLRAKTLEFKARIKTQTKELDSLIEAEQNKAEALSEGDLMARDAIYQNIDTIKKDRDQEIEKVLWEILPEAYAVVKEAARRFTNEEELITTVVVELTDNQGVKSTFSFKDLDGEGGNAPSQFDPIVLGLNKTYSGKVKFLNESVSPADDITKEIKAEANDHQFYFVQK